MKRAALLSAGALLAVSPAAAAPPPTIWPVEGLYGFENSVCTPKEGGQLTAMIARPLCPALSETMRRAAGRQFVASMRGRFPAVVDKFAATLPLDATPRAKLASGLIASLRLARATIWTVDKGAGVDGFLPITLTLDITNPATGEVVFTRTHSDVGRGIFFASSVETELASQLPGKLISMIDALVASAAAEWRPERQAATVVGRAGDSWVIDRGRRDGLRTDDSIGADGQVTFAGPDYAIVRPVLGEYKVGQTLERTNLAPAHMLARPSVLTAMVELPDGYSATYLTQIFEDALGSRAALSPMPVNPGFTTLRGLAISEAQMPSSDARPLPDYVAAVSIVALPPASIASNIPGVTIDRHVAAVFVSLIDRSGRVVHSVQGHNRIEDQVSGDMRFSVQQRRDTVIRNALLDAATKLASFKPRNLELPVTSDQGIISIADPQAALPLDQQLTVLRPAGRIGRIGRVYYPVGEVRTAEVVTGGVRASDASIAPLIVRTGDVVSVEQAGPGLGWRQTISRCLAQKSPRIDDRGSVPALVASAAADAFFPAHFGAPVRRWDVPRALAGLKAEFANWERFAPAADVIAGRCYVPVVAVTPGAKAGSYALVAGYTLFEGETKLMGSGLQATLTATRIPASTPTADADAILSHDIASGLLPLMERAAISMTNKR